MPSRLKIGTRNSVLALWQAKHIQSLLLDRGYASELVPVTSDGDIDLKSPLYEMGVQGIFTRALDIALLNKTIDIAVHSLKDVPTQTAEGVVIAAVPQRGNPFDVLVYKDRLPAEGQDYMVATSSLRRAAQWRHKYPHHKTTPIRGNINTRLKKLTDNAAWDAAIFAKAGIERIQLEVPQQVTLDWMIPAPAQGALGIATRANDDATLLACRDLNHADTQITTGVERSFLRILMAGCTMPVGAYAAIIDDKIHFTGCVAAPDGSGMVTVKKSVPKSSAAELAKWAADELLNQDGREILERHTRSISSGTFRQEPSGAE